MNLSCIGNASAPEHFTPEYPEHEVPGVKPGDF